MDSKLFATVFVTVFLAEMGDKTQLATVLFASDERHGKWTVLAAAALALCAVAAIGVLAGRLVGSWVSPRALKIAAGVGFVAIGAWTLLKE